MVVSGNIASWLLDSALAAGAGARVALREGHRTWTYDQLADQVSRLSSALRALQLGRGDRVLILMRDTLEAAAGILAAMHAGAVAVPISELSTPDDVQRRLQHSGACIALTDASHEAIFDAIRSETPALRHVICVEPTLSTSQDFHALVAAARPEPAVPTGPADVSLLFYSTSAGLYELRAVAHSRRTIEAACEAFAGELLGLSSVDRVLSVVRLSTALGLAMGLVIPLAHHAESQVFPAQPQSGPLFDAVGTYGPTVLFATPSVYAQLVHDADGEGIAAPLASLRRAIASSEGMPERLIPRIRSVLGTEVVVGYGLTEVFRFALASRTDDPDARAGVCGKPLAGVEARLVGEDGEAVGVDEIGTLELRCASLCEGYWGAHHAVQTVRAGGWLRTRDRFLVDSHGFYHYCGRVDDMFKVGGKWVSPSEVERALTAHEGVWECAVIGAADDDGLIKPLAFVVPNVGWEGSPELEAELREYVKQTLAAYKYPRWIEFINALPRGPGGKLLRYKLRPGRRRRRAETGVEPTQ